MASGKSADHLRRLAMRTLRASVDSAQRGTAESVPGVQEPVLGSPAQTEEAIEGQPEMTIVAMPIKHTEPVVEPLIPGEYYWVTRVSLPRAGEWFIARYESSGWTTDGGWHYDADTVVQWKRIERP